MDSINIDAIGRVESYIKSMKRLGFWSDNDVKAYAYRQFAAREIINLLKNNVDYSPLEVMDYFITEMNDYKDMNSNNSFIFSEIISTVEDIISYMLK